MNYDAQRAFTSLCYSLSETAQAATSLIKALTVKVERENARESGS